MNLNRRYLIPAIIVFFIIALFGEAVFAQNSIKLEEDTTYFTGLRKVMFKKGTTVSIDENGKARAGFLALDTPLEYNIKYHPVTFKAGTHIGFYENGCVISGTLMQTTALPYSEKYVIISFMANTVVGFYEYGIVNMGVLAADTNLLYKGAMTNFKEGTVIVFKENGEVHSFEEPK